MSTARKRIFLNQQNPDGIELPQLIKQFQIEDKKPTQIEIQYPVHKPIKKKRRLLCKRKDTEEYVTYTLKSKDGIKVKLAENETGIVIISNNQSLLLFIRENPLKATEPSFALGSSDGAETLLYVPEEYIKSIE